MSMSQKIQTFGFPLMYFESLFSTIGKMLLVYFPISRLCKMISESDIIHFIVNGLKWKEC